MKRNPFLSCLILIFSIAASSCSATKNILPKESEIPIQTDPHQNAKQICKTLLHTDAQTRSTDITEQLARDSIQTLRKYNIFDAYGCYHYLDQSIPPIPLTIEIDPYSLKDVLDNHYSYLTDDEINHDPEYQEAIAKFENTKEGYEEYKMPEFWDIVEYSPFKPYMTRLAIQKQWPYMLIRLSEDDYRNLELDEIITLLTAVPAQEFYKHLEASKDKHDIFLMTTVFPTVIEDSRILQLASTLSPLRKYLKDDALDIKRIKKYKINLNADIYGEQLNNSIRAFETGRTEAALQLMNLYFEAYNKDHHINTDDGFLDSDDVETNPVAVNINDDVFDDEHTLWQRYPTERMVDWDVQAVEARYEPRFYDKYPIKPIDPYIGMYRKNRWSIPVSKMTEKYKNCNKKLECENEIHREVLNILRPQKTTLGLEYKAVPKRKFVHDANFLGIKDHNFVEHRLYYSEQKTDNNKLPSLNVSTELISDRCSLNEISDTHKKMSKIIKFIEKLNQIVEQGQRHEAIVIAHESFISCDMPSSVSQYIKLLEPGDKITYINNDPILLLSVPDTLLEGQYIPYADVWELNLVQMAAEGKFDYSSATRSERGLIAEIAMIFGNYSYAEELSREIPIFSGDWPHYYIFKRVRGLTLVGLRRFDEAFEHLKQRSFIPYAFNDPCMHRPMLDDYDYHWRIVMLEAYEITGQTPLTLIDHPDLELAQFYTKINNLRRSISTEESIFLLEEAIVLAKARGDETEYQSLITRYLELGFGHKSDFLTRNHLFSNPPK